MKTLCIPTADPCNGGPQFLVMPGNGISISACGRELFARAKTSGELFYRGGAVMRLTKRDDDLLSLEVLTPAAARSQFERYAKPVAWRSGADSEPVLKPVVIPEETAKALLSSSEAADQLPRVSGLANCPILRESGDRLTVAGPGYDAETGLFVTGGSMPPQLSVDDARSSLLELLDDFEFQTLADKSRAVASLLTPALRMGRFLKRVVPTDVAEADQSQSGKGFRQKLTAAVYNERVSLVTLRRGGVGSVDESFSQALICGRPFIQFDNFRGHFDSTALEAFLTCDGLFPCRAPGRGEVFVQPENFFIFLSSNGVDTTRDLANRSNIVRIRKRPRSFQFRCYPEGDLLEHVRANQPHYLGAVFAIIRAWHDQGRPRTNESSHDFREWVGVLDFIVTNILDLPPLMDGHRELQERVSNPALVWLRAVALAVAQANELGAELSATDIFEACEAFGIQTPGVKDGADADRGKRVVGGLLGKLFREQEEIPVDEYVVRRRERQIPRADGGGPFLGKFYTITRE